MTDETPLDWYDLKDLGIEGKGWTDTAAPYERLPAKAKGVVPDAVWERSRAPAGICAHFETDATELHARWSLEVEPPVGPQMPATGCSGLDLYAIDAEGRWRWVHCFPPSAAEATAAIAGFPPAMRTFRLYLPLRNFLKEARVGVPRGSRFRAAPARTEKPIVYYGTSIVHGAGASRPGMCHAAILGRRLDRPMINLGFGGNGRMEPEVADLLAELDPCVYLVDCLPNMTAELVAERAAPLVRRLREAHADVPIVLIEDRTYANSWIFPAKRERNDTSRQAFRAAYEELLAEGVKGLHYVEGEQLLGDDDEATVDSSHPTDLGFWRYADILEPVVAPLIASSEFERAPRKRPAGGAQIKFSDVRDAYDFVSSDSDEENAACLSRETGEIRYFTPDGGADEGDEGDLDDLEASGTWAFVPHKNDLDLGHALVFDFVAERLPDDHDQVRDIFRRRGAYGEFKDLLARRGLLDEWFAFENEREEEALRAWCQEEGIELDD